MMMRDTPGAATDLAARLALVTMLLRGAIFIVILKVFDDCWDSAALTLGMPASASHKIAHLTGYPEAIGWGFAVAMALMLPAMALVTQILPTWALPGHRPRPVTH